MASNSLGPGSALRKKRKKSASEAIREVVSQTTAELASLADIFPIWLRFLPYSPTAEPGPRLDQWRFSRPVFAGFKNKVMSLVKSWQIYDKPTFPKRPLAGLPKSGRIMGGSNGAVEASTVDG